MVARGGGRATSGRPSVVGLCVEPAVRSAGMLAVAPWAGGLGPALAVLAVAALASAVLAAWVASRCVTVEVDADGVRAGAALVGRTRLDVPLGQVSGIEVSQGPLAVALGYGDLSVATTSGGMLELPCVVGAAALRDGFLAGRPR